MLARLGRGHDNGRVFLPVPLSLGEAHIMAFQLKADKNPLFVTNAIATVTTKVKYDASQRIFLWRRTSITQWEKEDLIDGAIDSDDAAVLERRGTRTTPALQAGQFVEYGMLTMEELDPNSTGFSLGRFVAYVIIDVLLSESTLVAPIPDNALVPGGTFVRKIVNTTVPTRLRMQVGTEPPVTGANNFPTLPNPLAVVSSNSQALQHHDVEAKPLVSGTPHVALTLLISATGAWQAVKENFKTKRRKVTIQFKKFNVHNDSDEDPWGEGDNVEIWFRVYNGDTMVNDFKWGPGQISDEGLLSEIGLNFPDAVVGPDELNGEDPGVGVSIYALERDWITIPILGIEIPSTDEATYDEYQAPTSVEGRKIKRFDFPVGDGSEIVNPGSTATNFNIIASPIGGDGDLLLTARVRYAVTYE
jgi:hypothetical protein